MAVLYLAAILMIISVCIARFCFRKVFYSPLKRRCDPYALPGGEQYQNQRERMLSLVREMDEIPYEPVSITAFDGTELFGRYYHVRDGAPLQLQFHGYHGTALRDFCGGNKLAREAGQNTLVVDQRAHGKSGGTVITFGILERQDCLAWARYAVSRFGPDTPVFLSGVSMGASTVLMASELALPSNIAGIIADCPYSSPEAIMRKVCRADMHLPPALVLPFIRLGARLFGHFDLRETDAVRAVKNTDIPILLLHGEDDRFVPCEMSREICAACAGDIAIVTFPSAGHGLSYIVDTEKYEKEIYRFVSRCLQRFGGGNNTKTERD